MKITLSIKVRAQLITAGLCLVSGFSWMIFWYLSQQAQAEDLAYSLERAELQAQDWVTRSGKPAPISDQLVFLGFDKPNYEGHYSDEEAHSSKALEGMRKSYPWSRQVWAELIDRLAQAGAKVIVFDIIFASPSADPAADAALSSAIERHPDLIVLGANLNLNDGVESIVSPTDTLKGARSDWGDLIGVVNFFPDGDGVIRRISYRFPLLSGQYDSLAKQVLVKSHSDLAKTIPEGFQRFRYSGPAGTYKHAPIYSIFVPRIWENNYKNGAYFKDKIVMVGPAGNWTQDIQTTPYAGKMFGPEVHLNAIAAALSNSFIQEISITGQYASILALTLICLVLFIFIQHPGYRSGSVLLVSLLYVVLVRLVYDQTATLFILLPPLLAVLTATSLCIIQSFAATLLEKIRTRSMLERYVSQNFVKEILDQSGDFEQSLGGVRKKCTMLFSDIRGFTTMTESADSHSLVTQLNEYLSQMVECVFRNHGTLDKFIGDAVMAVWGNVQTRGDKEDAVLAVTTALEMLTELKILNQTWPARSFPELHIGVGVNHGEVIVGNMGSPKRKEFTVIGDAVNLASRLEGVTKEYGIEFVIGESVAELVRDEFHLQTVDFIRVKGKAKPVEVFTVLGKKSIPLASEKSKHLETYEKGILSYRALEFAQAKELFQQVLEDSDLRILAKLYTERCETLQKEPPTVGTWDGVYVMKGK